MREVLNSLLWLVEKLNMMRHGTKIKRRKRQTNHLRAWLHYRGIKQRQLSKKLAVSEGYISEIASNRKNPRSVFRYASPISSAVMLRTYSSGPQNRTKDGIRHDCFLY